MNERLVAEERLGLGLMSVSDKGRRSHVSSGQSPDGRTGRSWRKTCSTTRSAF